MGCFNEVYGTVRGRKCEEVDEIIKQLEDFSPDAFEVEEQPDGMLKLEVHYSDYCSYSRATEIDDTLKTLGPYTLEAAEFTTTCDGETFRYFVGTKSRYIVNLSIATEWVVVASSPEEAIEKVQKDAKNVFTSSHPQEGSQMDVKAYMAVPLQEDKGKEESDA